MFLRGRSRGGGRPRRHGRRGVPRGRSGAGRRGIVRFCGRIGGRRRCCAFQSQGSRLRRRGRKWRILPTNFDVRIMKLIGHQVAYTNYCNGACPVGDIELVFGDDAGIYSHCVGEGAYCEDRCKNSECLKSNGVVGYISRVLIHGM
jgi:hypothetical protein